MAEKKKEPIEIPPVVWFLGLVIIFILGGVFARIFPEDAAPATSADAASVQQTTNPVTVGLWQSTHDPKFTREFRADSTFVDRYEGDLNATQSGTWIAVDPTQENTGVPAESLVGQTVLKLTYSNGDQLYFTVNDLTPTSLRMTYLARGNVLSFTRIR